MAGFRKAKAEQAALKMGFYGPAGSGKTFTALLIAEGLAKRERKRVAFVDTERGTDFYCKDVPERQAHPAAFDFDALYTRSLTDTLSEVRKLDPNQYGVVVIDSVTHLWEAARNSYTGRVGPDGQIPFHAWGKIKKPYKELVALLLSSPMHFILCGRQGNEFAEDEETGETKRVGVKMKAEGETPYEPHILIRMEMEKDRHGVGQVVAFAEKDRTGVLSGKRIVNPTFETLAAPMVKLLGGTQANVETEDEVSLKDAEALADQDRQREAAGARLLKKYTALIQLAESHEALKEIGKQITPDLKKQMTTAQVNELRASYQMAEQEMAHPPVAPEQKPAAGRKPEPRVDEEGSQLDAAEVYANFLEDAWVLVQEAGSNDAEAFNKAIDRCLLRVKLKGKGEKTTPEWRRDVLTAIRERRGEFSYLVITEVAAA